MPVNIPVAFISRIQTQFATSASEFIGALNNSPHISLRLNSLKPCETEWGDNEKILWCSEGRYLHEKPVFTLDPLFHAGCYYPQEASSMVLDWLLRNVCQLPDEPKVLDLCAAPGGKSTLLSSFLCGKGLLVANEVIRNRAAILVENLMKWGAPNSIVTRNDPADFGSLNSFFDLMVIDAPCSGEGMFRKDQRAVDEWSEDNANMCSLRQQRILSDVWPALKEGGYLIYSTCTFNPAENEDNIAWLVREYGAEVLPVIVPESWGVASIEVTTGNGLAFYPHRVKGEGFFVAVLKKVSPGKVLSINRKQGKSRNNLNVPEGLEQLFSSHIKLSYFEEMDGWRAFPDYFDAELNVIQHKLNVLNYGVQIGKFIKKNLVPSHELAMSNLLNKQFFQKVDLPKYEALRFLKGESLMFRNECEKGYLLITYKEVPLGFVKNIGTRMNNLYPSGWRIRMSLPE